jgi:CDP-diacylglycerol--serine O-phosphatidyltransferase
VNSIREFLNPANALTSANLVAGFLGLLAAVDAHLAQATGLVILAAICDSLDGVVARRTGGNRSFGANLDSLADLVSFGVVPATAVYFGPLHSQQFLGVVICSTFLLAGAWRLARFPLIKRCSYFLGLPMPVAGVLLMVILLWRPGVGFISVITATASVVMVSTLPFPTLQAVGSATSTILSGNHERRLRANPRAHPDN